MFGLVAGPAAAVRAPGCMVDGRCCSMRFAGTCAAGAGWAAGPGPAGRLTKLKRIALMGLGTHGPTCGNTAYCYSNMHYQTQHGFCKHDSNTWRVRLGPPFPPPSRACVLHVRACPALCEHVLLTHIVNIFLLLCLSFRTWVACCGSSAACAACCPFTRWYNRTCRVTCGLCLVFSKDGCCINLCA